MTVSVNTSVLHYQKKGSGKKHLLLFHGFGQDHSVFASLMDSISEQYTCYGFDLFFHNESRWAHDEQPLSKKEWEEFVRTFILQEGIEEFSLLGFSIGARFVLATFELFPEKTQQIFLIAPDGLRNNFWYGLATSTVLSRKLFKSMINHPNLFFKAARLAGQLSIVDKSLLRFAEHQMNTETKRRKVYYTWVVFRKLKFRLTKVAGLIDEHQIKTTIVVGEHDKVISPAVCTYLTRHVKHCRVEILPTSHNRLIGECVRFMVD